MFFLSRLPPINLVTDSNRPVFSSLVPTRVKLPNPKPYHLYWIRVPCLLQ